MRAVVVLALALGCGTDYTGVYQGRLSGKERTGTDRGSALVRWTITQPAADALEIEQDGCPLHAKLMDATATVLPGECASPQFAGTLVHGGTLTRTDDGLEVVLDMNDGESDLLYSGTLDRIAAVPTD